MKIATIVGTRPQFIKAFPMSRAIALSSNVSEILIHTGQHFDDNMSAVFFSELNIPPPQHHLSITGKSHGAMTGQMLEAVERVLVDEGPDAVIVYGDTNSTLAGALAAAKLQLPLIHIEAGLRSFNRKMPEELNRVVTDHLSSYLFCPTGVAIENLRREGIVQGVHLVGDLMYDAMLIATPLAERSSNILERLGLTQGEYGIATVHRAQSTDDPEMLARILEFIASQARSRTIIFPLHPRTRAAAAKADLSLALPGVKIVDPIGFLDMCRLLHSAAIVLTDSGGLQKEAYFHRVPCVTLRDETEWVETVDCGWNRLWSSREFLPRRDISDYGTGSAAEQILAVLIGSLRPRSS